MEPQIHLLGRLQYLWYCFDLTDNKFYELDKPGGDQIQEFSCLEDLITNSH